MDYNPKPLCPGPPPPTPNPTPSWPNPCGPLPLPIMAQPLRPPPSRHHGPTPAAPSHPIMAQPLRPPPTPSWPNPCGPLPLPLPLCPARAASGIACPAWASPMPCLCPMPYLCPMPMLRQGLPVQPGPALCVRQLHRVTQGEAAAGQRRDAAVAHQAHAWPGLRGGTSGQRHRYVHTAVQLSIVARGLAGWDQSISK